MNSLNAGGICLLHETLALSILVNVYPKCCLFDGSTGKVEDISVDHCGKGNHVIPTGKKLLPHCQGVHNTHTQLQKAKTFE